ncbi:hypothetical protein [Acidisarcina polymorpha]|uniref:hypothetical protein n=1 Tax=Acidisarcina polymorpha TaxID=2211140 RepID=UPI001F1BB8CF|nr:hypothetical protein [Acidisarcina polymorpha]
MLPVLARDVYVMGYPSGRETEYVILLQRYVRQARALQELAGPNGSIHVSRCEEAGPLLQVLGYRLRNACGQKDASLAAFNPETAFLTIDSGFPLTQLEESLQTNTPFDYPYAPTRVPLLFQQTDWTNLSTWAKQYHPDLLDVLLHDPQVARLYWAVSRVDPETALSMERSTGLVNLLPHAAVLDFYGSQLCIRSGKVLVPGGPAAEDGWKDLVGASPESPRDFTIRLLAQDRGWLAAYFDTIARVDREQQTHLTKSPRLRRLYEAFREPDGNEFAARASFRRAPALLVLFTRQQWQPNGEPLVPGNLEIWRQIVGRHGRHWSNSEQLLESMVSFTRSYKDNGPVQTYLTLSELDRERPPQNRLSPETTLLMAQAYPQFSDWYLSFSEFPELNDSSINRFIHAAESLNRISDEDLRGDALGIFQANLGLWQILARQGEIPYDQLAPSWQKTIDPFGRLESSAQLFDAGERSLSEVLLAATGKPTGSQGEIVELLAGPPQKTSQGQAARSEVAGRIRSVMEDQRLTPLDTLFELNRGLSAMTHGAPPSAELRSLTGELRDFEMPRRIFTENEKAEWAPGVFNRRHAQLQLRTDLAKIIGQTNQPGKLEAARGQLTPFLRDTLVGLNYAYYEPPGSQILHINPLFVRSHDFAGATVSGINHVWQSPGLFGAGAPAGGGAYLVGSLADLPYAVAAAEQDFIAPANVQALIWQEIVPNLLAGATLSRWWNVSPHELHAVALYQRAGEDLLNAAAANKELRERLVPILSERMSPLRMAQMEQAMQSGEVTSEIARLLPADTFYLAVQFRQRYPNETSSWGESGQALDNLSRQYPAEVGLDRISKDFGIPHPALAQTYGREMLSVRPFPAVSGYASRLFSESWDSTNLYWARLGDERGISPETLNVLSPLLTHLMISKIFASHFEDWPAVVRAMHGAGEDFLQGKLTSFPGAETTARR